MKFKEAKQELEYLADGKYFSIAYSSSQYASGKEEVECAVYIDGYDFCTSENFVNALDKLRRKTKTEVPVETEEPEGEL